MLSGPPETATATSGRASKPPSASSSSANSSSVSGTADNAVNSIGSTAEALLFRAGVLPDGGPRIREIVGKLGERDTSVLLLVGAAERHCKLQQIVRGLGAFWVALVALGKRACRL